MKIDINILTITKNDFVGLKRTVDSTKALREKGNVRQLIIDSSDSDIKKLVSDFALKEKNIAYLWQEPKGISEAFNYGLKETEEGWIWCLNGGDIIKDDLDNEWFLNYLSISKADAIIFQTVDMATGVVLEKTPPMWGTWPPLLSWIPHPSTIIKKKIFNEFGFFDERYKLAMDYELYLRFFSKNISVDLVSVVIAAFNREGASNQFNKRTRAEVAKIIRRYFWVIIKKELWSLRIILKSLIINSRFVNYKKDKPKP